MLTFIPIRGRRWRGCRLCWWCMNNLKGERATGRPSLLNKPITKDQELLGPDLSVVYSFGFLVLTGYQSVLVKTMKSGERCVWAIELASTKGRRKTWHPEEAEHPPRTPPSARYTCHTLHPHEGARPHQHPEAPRVRPQAFRSTTCCSAEEGPALVTGTTYPYHTVATR